ncbi:hypothetical protein DAEQUDRAFT_764067 [Daedalea quercina L-15889]|uniref:Uncharacterized protein n=1 Tax=Daedalea quercina L-15889 TaxID=1314783 RepID=A0A165RTC4_9APHY|nr:hypothetical protein DAEQUDRAFT_764067 [Daedalea quercina L-15889]
MNNSYAPDDTAAQLYAEETWFQGALLGNIAYGAELTLFIMSFNVLYKKINESNRRTHISLLAFIMLIFVLGTLFMAFNAKFAQMAFIQYRNFPGGPGAYEEVDFSNPIDEVANVCFIIGNWLMDALLVWRCFVIYRNCRKITLFAVLVLPCLLLLASVATGTAELAETHTSSPFQYVNITLAYFSMTIALNVIVTILIVCRLLVYRWRVARVMGPNHTSEYATMTAIIIESAIMYSAFAILFIVPFGIGNSLGNVFLQTVSQVQTASSLLIVYRLASGRGWTENTCAQILTKRGASEIQLDRINSLDKKALPDSTTDGTHMEVEPPV